MRTIRFDRDLTTGDVARLLRLSETFVRKMFDEGELKGYRHPGGARGRRVRRADVVRFAQEHGIPLLPEGMA